MRSDAQLLEAWRGGDRQAGKLVFERHYEGVARFFRNKVGAEAPDLVQKTFLACVESIEDYRGDGTLRSYLFSIAYRQLCKFYRSRATRRARFDLGEVTAFDLDPSPSRVAVKRREQRLLLEGLRRISATFQIVLELHYWEQMSTSEIGRVLDVPQGTVKSRLRRGRELLVEQVSTLSGSRSDLESTVSDLEGWAAALRGEILHERAGGRGDSGGEPEANG